MAQSNTRLSPRQKMINLMYIVLTAMLALNVSSDVLDGFKEVEDGLARTNETASDRNSGIYGAISAMALQNPEKGNPWLAKATAVRQESQRLYDEIDSLKYLIVRESDGEDGNPREIVNLDDLESAAVVMLNPATRLGEKLRQQLDSYSGFVTKMIGDSAVARNIKNALSTAPIKKPGIALPVKWEIAKFEGQPVVAAVTHLTKLQNDLRYARENPPAASVSHRCHGRKGQLAQRVRDTPEPLRHERLQILGQHSCRRCRHHRPPYRDHQRPPARQ